jgi:hypothetical protein
LMYKVAAACGRRQDAAGDRRAERSRLVVVCNKNQPASGFGLIRDRRSPKSSRRSAGAIPFGAAAAGRQRRRLPPGCSRRSSAVDFDDWRKSTARQTPPGRLAPRGARAMAGRRRPAGPGRNTARQGTSNDWSTMQQIVRVSRSA